MSKWLRSLNAEQQQAVLHTKGPLLILAGAGSGKTTVLISRSGRLIEEGHCAPEKLCVLTFTNKAARELKSRVSLKLGPVGSSIYAGTFHSFGLKILRTFWKESGLPRDFSILDPTDTSGIVKELLVDFKTGTKDRYEPDRLVQMLGKWREDGTTSTQLDDPYHEATEWLLPRFEKRMKLLGAVDFDSLLMMPLNLMNTKSEVCERIQGAFDFVMVDEFQDTNKLQMKLVKKLIEPHKNIAVVGDDDQSIYGWRGACISNILDFPKMYSNCRVVRLEQNYRSNPSILALANAIIEKNSSRHKKILKPTKTPDADQLPELFVCEDEDAEAALVGDEIERLIREGHRRSDLAVLYRSNGQGALIEGELRKRRIPYTMSGGTALFDRKETRDALSYLRCAFRPSSIHLKRIINTPPRGVGDRTLEQLDTVTGDKKGAFVSAARRWRDAQVDPKIGAQLDSFFAHIDGLSTRMLQGVSTPGNEFLSFLKAIGYQSFIEKTSRDPHGAQARMRLLEVFCHVIDKFTERGGRNRESIIDFIDSLELRDGQDDVQTEDAVQLMTLHACKGLEFPYVFLIGVEEDILPHKTLGTDVSEERRLFYVGVTRAEKHLVMTRARERKRFGRMAPCAPSRFLLELPKESLKIHEGGSRFLGEDHRKAMLQAFLST